MCSFGNLYYIIDREQPEQLRSFVDQADTQPPLLSGLDDEAMLLENVIIYCDECSPKRIDR